MSILLQTPRIVTLANLEVDGAHVHLSKNSPDVTLANLEVDGAQVHLSKNPRMSPWPI